MAGADGRGDDLRRGQWHPHLDRAAQAGGGGSVGGLRRDRAIRGTRVDSRRGELGRAGVLRGDAATWAGSEAGTLWRAMTGSEAVLHVEHVAPPVAGPGVRAVVLRSEESAAGGVRARVSGGRTGGAGMRV
ncbi:hypothetical protein AB5I41_27365 [Sphingomonas sp. MMS24-JH45]